MQSNASIKFYDDEKQVVGKKGIAEPLINL